MRSLIPVCVLFLAACGGSVPTLLPSPASPTNAAAMEKSPPTGPRRPQVIVGTYVDAPVPDNMLAGESGRQVSIWRFHARGEPMELNEFTLHNVGDDETVESVTATYWATDGSIRTQTAYLAAGNVTFTGADMFVPIDREELALLVIGVDSDNGADARAGMTLQLDWSDRGVEVLGLNTGNVYGPSVVTNRAAGTEMVWHLSEPTFDIHSATPRETVVRSDDSETLRWSVAAASTGDLMYFNTTFGVSTTDNAGVGWNTCERIGTDEAWTVLDLTEGGTVLDGDEWTFHGIYGSDCSDAPDEPVGYAQILGHWSEVNAGDTHAYSLTINLECDDCTATDDTIQTDILGIGWTDDWDNYDAADGVPLYGEELLIQN